MKTLLISFLGIFLPFVAAAQIEVHDYGKVSIGGRFVGRTQFQHTTIYGSANSLASGDGFNTGENGEFYAHDVNCDE